MNREVIVSGKTRVVAETLAEIVNGFVEVISFKTMVNSSFRFPLFPRDSIFSFFSITNWLMISFFLSGGYNLSSYSCC